MSRLQYIVLLVVAALFSTMGGIISTWLLNASDVLAGKEPARKIVEAEEFRLVDSTGRVRGKFSMLAGEFPGLVMRQKNGDTAIALGIAPDGSPSLALTDQSLARQAEFGFLPETKDTQMLGVRVTDRQRKFRLYMGIDSDDVPTLCLADKNG